VVFLNCIEGNEEAYEIGADEMRSCYKRRACFTAFVHYKRRACFTAFVFPFTCSGQAISCPSNVCELPVRQNFAMDL
jgi:hypothetical protein